MPSDSRGGYSTSVHIHVRDHGRGPAELCNTLQWASFLFSLRGSRIGGYRPARGPRGARRATYRRRRGRPVRAGPVDAERRGTQVPAITQGGSGPIGSIASERARSTALSSTRIPSPGRSGTSK